MYSIGAEVFALNNMLCLDSIRSRTYIVRRDVKKYPSDIASQAALICGLGLTNQHTAIFYVIVIASVVAYDVLVHPEFCSGSTAKEVGCLLAGNRSTEAKQLCDSSLLPYVYLPLAARNPQKGSGGFINLMGFLLIFFGWNMGRFHISAEFKSEGLLERLQYYTSDANFNFAALDVP